MGSIDGLARLRPRDRKRVLAFLSAHSAQNAYLLAQVSRGALARDDLAGPIVGHWREGQLDGVAIFGSNLVLSTPCAGPARSAFAHYARMEGFRVWVLVGEDHCVADFMESYGRRTRHTLLERPGQLLYAMRSPPTEEAGAIDLRQADIKEAEALIRMDRAMVHEELGFDPFSRDLDSYRRGWKRRIREGRSFVVTRDGTLLFKVDHSASSEQVIQLAGVYTLPSERRQGVAMRAMTAMCTWALERVPTVTLYVDSENAPAIKLYEKIGFERVGLIRSIWFGD